eukprot:COSAG02_NODE_2411_length_8920_cov_5.544496_3_plen_171_part_00
MPFHYNAIAHKLLELCVHATVRTLWPTLPADTVTFARSAAEDIEAEATNAQEVHACRKLLRDIEDVRTSKIRKGTRMVMDEVKAKDHVHDVSSLINFRNLTFTELNNTRPTLTKALDTLADINPRTVSIRQHLSWPLRPSVRSRRCCWRGCTTGWSRWTGAGWGRGARRG